jgi:hypothetical protein
MKRRLKLKYPVWTIIEKEVEVDIPDDEDPENWIGVNEKEILEDFTDLSSDELMNAIDYGYADVELLE